MGGHYLNTAIFFGYDFRPNSVVVVDSWICGFFFPASSSVIVQTFDSTQDRSTNQIKFDPLLKVRHKKNRRLEMFYIIYNWCYPRKETKPSGKCILTSNHEAVAI